jgi:hypothetical protein
MVFEYKWLWGLFIMAKKIWAAILLVIAGVLVAPMAANAAYSSGSGVVSGNAVPGGTVSVAWADGTFGANDPVRVTVDGQGTVTIAAFKAATVSAQKTADADGALAVSFTLPSDASGTYNVTATDLSNGNIGTATFTVGSAAGNGGSGAAGSSSGSGLADTGSTISILAFWFAGGIVLLGAAFVAVRVIVRRQSRSSNA